MSASASAEPSDESLMCAYRDGDAAAFDRLYARHRGPVYRFFRRQLDTAEAADELFQDVWMKLIDARNSYTPQAKFTTYLYTIAHNRLMDHFRARTRAGLRSLDADEDIAEALAIPDHELPMSIAERRQCAEQLRTAVADLPFAQREALLLHAEGELSLEEIAVMTGTQRETVKSRIRYAVSKLRRELSRTAAE
ncbi:MAG: RNA polymerase sigma factor [Acetobacteraceae bacterium]|nr:RNA polymerase sigma factor [Acetobacteraceae bacterium]